MNDVLTPVDIERQIVAISDAMEAATYLYGEQSDEAASAEADYKARAARTMIGLAADASSKSTVGERQARVDLHCADEYRRWRLAEARRQATRETLLTLRARLDAMRTLSASIRHQT